MVHMDIVRICIVRNVYLWQLVTNDRLATLLMAKCILSDAIVLVDPMHGESHCATRRRNRGLGGQLNGESCGRARDLCGRNFKIGHA